MRYWLLLALLAPKLALAQDLELQLTGMVREGQGRPTLILRAKHIITGGRLTLSRNGGPPEVFDIAALRVDETHTIELTAPVGEWTYAGAVETHRSNGSRAQTTVEFAVVVLPSFSIAVPDERIDLEKAVLQLQMSRPAGGCEYRIVFDGADADAGTVEFAGEPGGTWLTVPWHPCGGKCAVLGIFLHCWDNDGNKTGLELFPWWLEIPHEDVNFTSGGAAVPRREMPKLHRAYKEIAAAITRYDRILTIRLFISGHTDTVGDAAVNRSLSLERARALALRLRKLGVKVPILYTGFGEQHLAVKTADDVDEPRNRRALYILAVDPPNDGDWHELGGTP